MSWSDGLVPLVNFSAWPRWARAMILVCFIIIFTLPLQNLFFKIFTYNKCNLYLPTLITTSDQFINLISRFLCIYIFVKILYMISANAYLFASIISIYDKLQMLTHLLLPFWYMISPNAYLIPCKTSMMSSNAYLITCKISMISSKIYLITCKLSMISSNIYLCAFKTSIYVNKY